MPYRIAYMSRPSSTLAAAVSFLSEFEPFASLSLKGVVATITGAIERDHCGFVVDDEKRIVGFGCYALADEATVARMLAGEAELDSALGRAGEVVVMLMTAAREPEVVRIMLREMGRRFPGRRWVQRRAGRARPHHGRFPKAAAGA